jgi:chromosome partitioning protein
MTTTIAVLNQKGGSGKSTLAQNLAACAHLRGKRTLLRDGDVQRTSHEWWAARPENSRLRGLIVERADDVKLWTFNRFREVAQGYDIVICDTPASLGPVTNATAIVADVVLVPMKPLPADVWAAVQTKLLLDEADSQRAQWGIPPVRRLMVFNDVRARTRDVALCRKQLEPLGMGLLPMHISQRVAFHRALGAGESVLTAENDSEARAEIEALFNALITTSAEGVAA